MEGDFVLASIASGVERCGSNTVFVSPDGTDLGREIKGKFIFSDPKTGKPLPTEMTYYPDHGVKEIAK
jgi:hypothetical protein